MPPLVPRKRLRESSPVDDITAKNGAKKGSVIAIQKRKPTLYDDLDASASTNSSKKAKSLFHDNQEDDSESSLTSLSDDDFEDVPFAKRLRAEAAEDDEDDEDIEFEDVEAPDAPTSAGPAPSGDLELTLTKDSRMSLTDAYGDKKGRTKREKQVRNAAHCLHVLTLLWHNAIRNSWTCHPEVQALMLSHLPPRLWEEVDRWRRNSGLEKPAPPKSKANVQSKGKKGKGKAPTKESREARDWSSAADKLEEGAVDMSHGDPLFRLIQTLSSWWKQRYRITVPGLRKWGYMPLERLDRITRAYNDRPENQELFGERLQDLDDFLRCARRCQGSRDVGAQLFTALLRGLGLDARMVANLQCLGFGWNKLEDADSEKEGELESMNAKQEQSPSSKNSSPEAKRKGEAKKAQKGKRKSSRAVDRKDYIVLDDTDDLSLEYKDSDDESVIELESIPRRAAPPRKKFDKDLEFPHYWTEVLSPVTNKYLSVDALVKGVVATNRDLVESLEPRGAKADKARQMMGYVVAYSSDGTAKDVTVRYLKKQLWPGRTKGSRMPLVKIPVYNKHGKVKRYEHFDWFKTAMSGYRRGDRAHPLTEIDELEDSTDLKPSKPEKKEVKEGEETLQYYKQSKEFALERHFKREEALRPRAKPVKVFKNKGKGGKVEEEDVYLRSDVVNVKSAETWHKQGRAPLEGEQPLKRVPYRAATLNRRREILEAEAATGQKVLQGLFSYDQTDWIIPPPIKDGIIPKNDYGNIDLFAEHMCPEGAVHVPFRGAIKVCKRLQIDYAEAVVDFEFGHRMAVPVIQGVVVAVEYHDQVMEELRKDEAERIRKEDEKRRKAALGRWRKFLMGMRIVKRIREEYGHIDDSVSVFGHHKGAASHHKEASKAHHNEEDTGGGFLPEGYEEEGEEGGEAAYHTSSFFPVGGDEDEDEAEGAGDGLIMEDHRDEATNKPSETEELIERPSKKAKKARASTTKPKSKSASQQRSSRAKKEMDYEEEEEDEESEGSWENPDGDEYDD